MAKFVETYSDREFVQQLVAQILQGYNIVLLDKIADMDERKWYIKRSAENGWSRNVLVHQIESRLYQRQILADKTAEYSLKDISKPIGVREYKITSSLPDDLEKQLSSVEDIQKRIK